MKLFKSSLLILLFIAPQIASSATLDELLKKVQQEDVAQTAEYKKREAQFRREKGKQQGFLNKANAELTALEKETARLMVTFDKNEKALTIIEDELNIALGTLGEMFGVVRQVAGDLKGQLENSVVSAQIRGRMAFVADIAESKSLPNIPKLERLWFELQREMTETGKTTQFKTTVVKTDGEKQEHYQQKPFY